MCAYQRPSDEETSSTAALTALLVVVVLALVFIVGYFAWYAPRQQAGTQVEVTVPERERDIQVVPPPSRPGGEAAGPEEDAQEQPSQGETQRDQSDGM